VRRIDQTRRPVAVICHGGWLLISARLVRGRHLTSYKTTEGDFRRAGAFWADREVVREGNWVSSRQPSDIPRFNEEMLTLFIDYEIAPALRPELRWGGAPAARLRRIPLGAAPAPWSLGGFASATMNSGTMPLTVPMFTLRDYEKRDFESLFKLDRLCFDPACL